ncbi:hypothetical protein D3C75_840150 [compost metagenome]
MLVRIIFADREVDGYVTGVRDKADAVVFSQILLAFKQGFLQTVQRFTSHAAGDVSYEYRCDRSAAVFLFLPQLLRRREEIAIHGCQFGDIIIQAVEPFVLCRLLILILRGKFGELLDNLHFCLRQVPQSIERTVMPYPKRSEDITAFQIGRIDKGLIFQHKSIEHPRLSRIPHLQGG